MRALGSFFLFLACVAALLDFYFAEMDGEAFTLHAFGEAWFRIHQESFVLLQPAIERHVHPDLWFAFFEPMFQIPGVLLFGGLGLLFWIVSSAFTRRSRAY